MQIQLKLTDLEYKLTLHCDHGLPVLSVKLKIPWHKESENKR